MEDNRGGLTDEDNGDEDQNQGKLRGGLTDEDNGDEDQNKGKQVPTYRLKLESLQNNFWSTIFIIGHSIYMFHIFT